MRSRILPFVAVFALLFSCEGLDQPGTTDDNGNEPGKPVVDSVKETKFQIPDGAPLAQTVEAEATKAESVSFTAPSAWKAESNAGWTTVSPASGAEGTATIAFTLEANTAQESRTATIHVSCDTDAFDVTITQAAAPVAPAGSKMLKGLTFTMVPLDGEFKELMEKNIPSGPVVSLSFKYNDKLLSEMSVTAYGYAPETLSYEYSGNNLAIYVYSDLSETAILDTQGKVITFQKADDSNATNTVNYDSAGHIVSITNGYNGNTWYSWFDVEYVWSQDEIQVIRFGDNKQVSFKASQYLNTENGADICAILRFLQAVSGLVRSFPGEQNVLVIPGLTGKRPKHIAEPVFDTHIDDSPLALGLYTEVYVNGQWKTCEELGIESFSNLGVGTWKVRRPASQPITRKIYYPAWKWTVGENGMVTRAIQPVESELFSHEADAVVWNADEDLNEDGVINDEDRYWKIQNEVRTSLGIATIDLTYVFEYQ